MLDPTLNPHAIPYVHRLAAARSWPRGYAQLPPMRLTYAEFYRLPVFHYGIPAPTEGVRKWRGLMGAGDRKFIGQGGRVRFVVGELVRNSQMLSPIWFRVVLCICADVGRTVSLLKTGQVWQPKSRATSRKITDTTLVFATSGLPVVVYEGEAGERCCSPAEFQQWIAEQGAVLVSS